MSRLIVAISWVIMASALQLKAQQAFSVKQRRVRFLIDLSYQFVGKDLSKRCQPQLDSVQKMAANESDERSLAYLQFIQLRMKKEEATQEKEKKWFAAQLEKITKITPYDDLKAYSFFWRGSEAFDNEDYTTGLPLLFKARKLLEETYYGKYPPSIYYYIGFFSMYYFFEDYKMAALQCQIALKEPPNAVFSPMGIYNNLGLCYLKMKQYDEAEKAFGQGIDAAKAQKHHNFEVLIRGNLGNLLRVQGKYKEALPYLYEEARVNEKAIPENAVISRFYIANALIMLDSLEKARAFLRPPTMQMPIWTYPTYDLIHYETTALYYTKTGNFNLASRFKDSLLMLKDSLKIKLDYKKVVVLESSLQAEKYINERKAMQLEAKNERLVRNVIIGFLFLLFLGIVYWINERRKQEKRLQMEKRRRAEEMLNHANHQLEQYLGYIKEKNGLIEQISDQMKAQDEPGPDVAEPILNNLQESILLTENDWTEFKSLFEQVFPCFFENLSKKYPDLTAAEVRLTALEKLNLTDKVKGNMLGISADSVKKSRYRIRKKYPTLIKYISTASAV